MTVTSRRLRAATWGVAVIATVAGVLCAVGLLRPPGPGPIPPIRSYELLAVCAGAVVLAQMLQLRVRVGDGEVTLAWGEAAVVVSCYLLPAGWVPLCVGTGVLVARCLLVLLGERRSAARIATNAATLALAGAAGATVASLSGVRPWAPLTLPVIGALTGAAAAYFATSVGLVSLQVATRRPGVRLRPVLLETLSSKAFMAIGNLLVGLVVVAVMRVNGWLLLLLPPVLWLLHQTYRYRLGGDDERRTWQRFSEATRQLNRLDERDVATAGLHGVQRLFGARYAQIVVTGPPGEPRAYTLGPAGEIRDEAPPDAASDDAADDEVVDRSLLVGGVRMGELRLRPGRPMSIRDRLMLGSYGDALAAALHDAATSNELRTLSERTDHDAAHDPLTGIANRAALFRLGNAALRAQPADAPVALLLFDINRFKQVNATLGHGAGDELLRVVADRLARAALGELLAHLGADEFALLLTGSAASLPYALAGARELRERLAAPSEVTGVQLSVEVSVGVVVATAGAVDIKELLRRAGVALEHGRREGSSVGAYDPGREEPSTDRLTLLAELREAIAAGDQLHLLLQPSVALDTGRPTGVEALVRWHHPRRGTLEPPEFIDVVEHSELVGPFTRYVMDHALAVAARWLAEDVEVPVAVNLSARSLLDPQLPMDVAHLLGRHRVPADRLVLEITETAVMKELPVIDDVLTGLRSLGVQLAVDDFGTGYSSLTFLTRVPVDEVKVDQLFVGQMVDSVEHAAIVRTTVDLCRELGVRVVAEGVESPEQRRALIAVGCPAAQGFHFHRPMPADRVVALLRSTPPPAQPWRAEDAG
jgi:diguanylate cyclase (GGDEF)-like protein